MGRIESISAGIRHKAWRYMCEKYLSSGMTVIEWYSENGTSKKTFSPSICSNCVAEVFILRRHIQVLYCVIVIERLCQFMLSRDKAFMSLEQRRPNTHAKSIIRYTGFPQRVLKSTAFRTCRTSSVV